LNKRGSGHRKFRAIRGHRRSKAGTCGEKKGLTRSFSELLKPQPEALIKLKKRKNCNPLQRESSSIKAGVGQIKLRDRPDRTERREDKKIGNE